jgi:hypothetical protein
MLAQKSPIKARAQHRKLQTDTLDYMRYFYLVIMKAQNEDSKGGGRAIPGGKGRHFNPGSE